MLVASLAWTAAAAAAETHTVTFKPSEGAGTFTIPGGVTGVEVLAIGGAGQAGGSCSTASGGEGGKGEKASADVNTEALLSLYVEFGGGATGGKGFTCNPGAGGAGGGASTVREGTVGGEPLVVAGGGGGGGGAGSSSASNHGGAGGSTEGKNGHAGESGLFEGAARGKGGEGATEAAGGKETGSGKNGGAKGSSFTGGKGGEAAEDGGGGGGGGYFGGAGGEAGEFVAGGGGAGASFIAAAPLTELAKFASAESSAQEVVITYEGGPPVGTPSVTIESPSGGEIYKVGQVVMTKFKCKEGANGPGLASCKDSNGNTTGEGELKTEHAGELTYTVTAVSKSGKSATKSISYRVAAPPQVHISPASGGFYLVNEKVTTSFGCSEGAGGTTLLSCEDSNGSKSGSGELNTSTVGRGEYSVTAKSSDGQENKLTITYAVLEGEKLVIFSEAESCATWSVPVGVVEPFEAVAIGQAGKHGETGNSEAPGAGGAGAEVSALISAAAGRQLDVCAGALGGNGGSNGDGSHFAAGGEGGGLSGVFGLPNRGEPLVVAGGGGGGGGSSSVEGGNGGAAEEAGEAGSLLESGSVFSGAGGTGGALAGNGGQQAGANGQETLGETSSGGGGGGAGFKGGGGGDSFEPSGSIEEASGGGGAGGENFCSPCSREELAPASQRTAVAIAYDVTKAPRAIIESPTNGATYVVGEKLEAKFKCEEEGGSKLKPGTEGCFGTSGTGGKVANGSALSTAHVGKFSLIVTAVSEDGLKGTTTVKYAVANKPTVSLSGVTANKIYAQNASVKTTLECREGEDGPGLEKCADNVAVTIEPGHMGVTRISSTDFLETATPGKFGYSVKARSYDGAEASKSVNYVVAAPPKATISAPPAGETYRLHQVVATKFTCEEGEDGSGLSACTDTNGAHGPTGGLTSSGTGSLKTTEVGEHTYTLTARSKDGQVTTTKLKYRVAAPPKAIISFPTSGGTYHEGEVIETSFRCEESTFGTGLSSCLDSNGSASPGTLNTSSPGKRVYEVTAKSTDGQEGKASIKYTVIS